MLVWPYLAPAPPSMSGKLLRWSAWSSHISTSAGSQSSLVVLLDCLLWTLLGWLAGWLAPAWCRLCWTAWSCLASWCCSLLALSPRL